MSARPAPRGAIASVAHHTTGAPEASLPPVPFLDLSRVHGPMADELAACWQRALATSDFIGGPTVERFEAEWAAACDATHAVGVANGTDALELGLVALGIGPGDEVIAPANTFVATIEAIVRSGARPVLVDVEPGRLLLTGDAVRGAVTPRTAAVIAVHLYGQPVDADDLRATCAGLGLALIEDAAQAHLARWQGEVVGSLGAFAAFSFYPGKNLGAVGDGGALVTDDPVLAERVRVLANHGRPASGHGAHVVVGTNSRLDAVQAAVLSAKLRRLEAWNEQRRTAAAAYRRLLTPHGIELLAPEPAALAVHHLEIVRVERRDEVAARLRDRGIHTGVHYPLACHQHEPYAAFAAGCLPVAERDAARVLSLPMFPGITGAEITRVADGLVAVLGELADEDPAIREVAS
ncbi:MAG: DegT/DnrJ/EryC1/StrS family aminotransferase [Actinomycetota bacterium]|nr:DegT/DnrJ/EryC1/StrS family aminotransferase [Actinomycetota bacterium]